MLVKRDPIRYCLLEIFSICTWYRYKTIRGLRATSQKNLSHFVHCPLVVADRLAKIPSVMLCDKTYKLSQKRSCLEVSTSSMAAPVDVKRPYELALQYPLDLVIRMGSRIFCCLICSQISSGVYNSGTIGEWLEGLGGGVEAMLM